jgi:hypothetical protein
MFGGDLWGMTDFKGEEVVMMENLGMVGVHNAWL